MPRNSNFEFSKLEEAIALSRKQEALRKGPNVAGREQVSAIMIREAVKREAQFREALSMAQLFLAVLDRHWGRKHSGLCQICNKTSIDGIRGAMENVFKKEVASGSKRKRRTTR